LNPQDAVYDQGQDAANYNVNRLTQLPALLLEIVDYDPQIEYEARQLEASYYDSNNDRYGALNNISCPLIGGAMSQSSHA
jgi:hypothetical protein